MNVDQRLHRAAHELREVEIGVPPLDLGSPTRRGVALRRIATPMATAMLLTVGAVGAVAELSPSRAVHERGPSAIVEPIDSSTSPPAAAVPSRPMSALEEVAMIAALNRTVTPEAPDREHDRSIPPGVS